MATYGDTYVAIQIRNMKEESRFPELGLSDLGQGVRCDKEVVKLMLCYHLIALTAVVLLVI